MVSLVSLDEVKAQITIGELDTEEQAAMDEKLMQIAELSTKLLQNYCRRDFKEQEFTQYFDTRQNTAYGLDITGDASNVSGSLAQQKPVGFNLRGFPVQADTLQVYYDPLRQYPESSLLDSTGYWYDADMQRLYITASIANSFRGLKVVFTAGYALGTDELADVIVGAPDDLRQACLLQCSYLYRKVQEANIGVLENADESPKYEINMDLLCTEAKAIAKAYRSVFTGRY